MSPLFSLAVFLILHRKLRRPKCPSILTAPSCSIPFQVSLSPHANNMSNQPPCPKQHPRLPRLTSDFIQVISQTVPGLPPLAPDLPPLLASHAEYHLRTVIHLAKKYMHHSKRTTLTDHDISLACKRRDRQPYLGYGAGPDLYDCFVKVPEARGLWVHNDDIVQLEDIIKADLPPPSRAVGIEGMWIVVGEGDEEEDDLVEEIDHAIQGGVEEQVERVCAKVETMEAGYGRIKNLVTYVKRRVEENARSGGSSDVLRYIVRVIYAMFGTRWFGVEVFIDDLMQALLTCMLGKILGEGDHWAVRDLAAVVLQEVLWRYNDAVVRGRVGKTIVAVLTDSQTNLESVYGAIRGLSAMGRDVFDLQMTPHLPALLLAVERTADACEGLEERSREVVEEKIAYVCRAIADVTAEGDEREE